MAKQKFDFRKELDKDKTLYRAKREGIDGDGVENDYTDGFGILLAKIMDGKATNEHVVMASLRSLLGYNNVEHIPDDEIESTAKEILQNLAISYNKPWVKNKKK